VGRDFIQDKYDLVMVGIYHQSLARAPQQVHTPDGGFVRNAILLRMYNSPGIVHICPQQDRDIGLHPWSVLCEKYF
jgi:hypothetical protein